MNLVNVSVYKARKKRPQEIIKKTPNDVNFPRFFFFLNMRSGKIMLGGEYEFSQRVCVFNREN